MLSPGLIFLELQLNQRKLNIHMQSTLRQKQGVEGRRALKDAPSSHLLNGQSSSKH